MISKTGCEAEYSATVTEKRYPPAAIICKYCKLTGNLVKRYFSLSWSMTQEYYTETYFCSVDILRQTVRGLIGLFTL